MPSLAFEESVKVQAGKASPTKVECLESYEIDDDDKDMVADGPTTTTTTKASTTTRDKQTTSSDVLSCGTPHGGITATASNTSNGSNGSTSITAMKKQKEECYEKEGKNIVISLLGNGEDEVITVDGPTTTTTARDKQTITSRGLPSGTPNGGSGTTSMKKQNTGGSPSKRGRPKKNRNVTPNTDDEKSPKDKQKSDDPPPTKKSNQLTLSSFFGAKSGSTKKRSSTGGSSGTTLPVGSKVTPTKRSPTNICSLQTMGGTSSTSNKSSSQPSKRRRIEDDSPLPQTAEQQDVKSSGLKPKRIFGPKVDSDNENTTIISNTTANSSPSSQKNWKSNVSKEAKQTPAANGDGAGDQTENGNGGNGAGKDPSSLTTQEQQVVAPTENSTSPLRQNSDSSSNSSFDTATSNSTKSATPTTETMKSFSNTDSINQGKNKSMTKSNHLTNLSQDKLDLLKRHETTWERYSQRGKEIVREATYGIEEENFSMPTPTPVKELDIQSEGQEFPDAIVANMSLLIEGSPLSLSSLTAKVLEYLQQSSSSPSEPTHDGHWTNDSVAGEIKLLAKRKCGFNLPATKSEDSSGGTATAATPTTTTTTKIVDLFENEDKERMWRWEIVVLDLLPAKCLPQVRKARAARKKLSSHYAAISKLLHTLEQAKQCILNGRKGEKQLESVSAKISRDEEKVLKYERDAEKQRIARMAKEKTQQRKAENEKKKLEAQQAKEEAKRKKTKERERKEAEQRLEAEQHEKSLKKQKATFMSFFSPAARSSSAEAAAAAASTKGTTPHQNTKKRQVEKQGTSTTLPINDTDVTGETNSLSSSTAASSFDVEKFRSMINSGGPSEVGGLLFPNLSQSAKISRKKRTRRVSVSVYETVIPEGGGFDAQPFAELKEISILNKYRFLSFREDCRPAYHGTWSKTSTVIRGNNPFAKDTTFLDYEYDSEAEWEEGDDEIGEDVEDDTKNQDDDEDEGDARVYDYDDGFCVADDAYLDTDENVDDETKALYKKKLQSNQQHGNDDTGLQKICIIAPGLGGVPINSESVQDDGVQMVEGCNKQEGLDFISSHQGLELSPPKLGLDAFVQSYLHDDLDGGQQASTATTMPKTNGNSGKDGYSTEEMKVLAKFVHYSPLGSKEKVVEDLRNMHPTMFSNRSKVLRKLDSIAVKKRKKKTSDGSMEVYWEVKSSVLEELGLKDLIRIDPVETTQDQSTTSIQKTTFGTATNTAVAVATAATKKGQNTKPTPNKGTKRKQVEVVGEKNKKMGEKDKGVNEESKKVPKKLKEDKSTPATSPPPPSSVTSLRSFFMKMKKKSTPKQSQSMPVVATTTVSAAATTTSSSKKE